MGYTQQFCLNNLKNPQCTPKLIKQANASVKRGTPTSKWYTNTAICIVVPKRRSACHKVSNNFCKDEEKLEPISCDSFAIFLNLYSQQRVCVNNILKCQKIYKEWFPECESFLIWHLFAKFSLKAKSAGVKSTKN